MSMSNKKKIMPKDIVAKWIAEVMTQKYTITVHPLECPFGEKFLRKLQQEGWDMAMVEDQKLVISSNDPIRLARLALKLRNKGHIIED